jgi:hypothetical protein
MQFPLCVLHCTLRKKTVSEKRKAGANDGLFSFSTQALSALANLHGGGFCFAQMPLADYPRLS